MALAQPGRMMPINWLTQVGSSVTSNRTTQGQHVPANLAATNPSKYWRSADSETSVILTLDFTIPRAVDSVALCLHNLSRGADIQFRFLNGQTLLETVDIAAHIPLYAFGVAPGMGLMEFGGFELSEDLAIQFPYTEVWLDNTLSCTSIEVEINDPLNQNGFLMMRYLMVSQSYRPEATVTDPAHNFDWSYRAGFISDYHVVDRPDGSTGTFAEASKREASIQWSDMSEAELVRMNQIIYYVRKTGEPDRKSVV